MPDLQVQQISSFLGTDENIGDMNLPEVFSSGGSKNVWMDKFGRVRRLDGWESHTGIEQVLGPAVFTNTQVWDLIPFQFGYTDQLVGRFISSVDQWIGYSNDYGYTWNFLTFLSGAGPDRRLGWAIVNQTLYLIHPEVLGTMIWDGTTLTKSSSMSTESPTITASATGIGNLNGSYKWKLVSHKTDGTRKLSGTENTQLPITAQQASLSWTADSDVNVDGYELYRTTGTGSLYYFVTFIAGRTTAAYTDNNLDSAVFPNRALEEHSVTTLSGISLLTIHKQRMWYAYTGAFANTKATVYVSDPNRPLSVSTISFDFNSSDVLESGLTGSVGDFENAILYFTEKSIYRISGTGEIQGDIVNWTQERTKATLGAVGPKSIVKIPAGAKYRDASGQTRTTAQATVAYVSPLGDVRLWDGSSDEIISHPLKGVLSDWAGSTGWNSRFLVPAHNNIERQEVLWILPLTSSNSVPGELDSSTTPSLGIVWNYRWGVWYVWDNMPFNTVVAMKTTSDANRLIGGMGNVDPDGGRPTCAWLHQGNLFGTSAINSAWMTKPLYGAKEEEDRVQEATPNLKRWRWADILVEVLSQGEMPDLEWFPGAMPNDTVAPYSVQVSFPIDNLTTVDGAYVLTTDGDYIAAGLSPAQGKIKLIAADGRHVHSEAIRLKVSSDHVNAPWIVSAINLAYQVMPGLRRRFQR